MLQTGQLERPYLVFPFPDPHVQARGADFAETRGQPIERGKLIAAGNLAEARESHHSTVTAYSPAGIAVFRVVSFNHETPVRPDRRSRTRRFRVSGFTG